MVQKKLGDLVKNNTNVATNNDVNKKCIVDLETCENELFDIIEKTRTIINSIHEGIIIYGIDLRYKEWNPFIERLSGFNKKDVIGKYPTEIFPFLNEYGIIEKLENILRGEEEVIQEFPLELFNKELSGSVLDTSKPLLDSKGNIIGILSIIKDLTDTKKDELELIILNRTLKMLTGCSQILLQVETEQKLLNMICEKITKLGGYVMCWVGYIDEENNSKKIIPKAQSGFEEGYLDSINIIWDKNDIKGQGLTSDTIMEGQPITICNVHNNPNYTPWRDAAIKNGYCSSIALPLVGNENTIIGALMVYSEEPNAFNDEEFKLLTELSQDLSRGIQFIRNKEEKNKTTELLKKSELQLQIRQRIDSLGTLAGGISHDFNNLLTGIMGNLELLKFDKNISTKNKEYVDNALKTSKRAANLIKQLQKLSINTISEKKSIDIYQIIREVFDLLDLDKKISNKIIDKIINFNVDQFYVKGNDSELHQVFLNLGINSLRAIEEDKEKKEKYFIKISADNYITNGKDINNIPKGDYIHITFEDNGKGMTEEVLNKAFDPFFTSREKSSENGQGIGLAMVYNVIFKSHDGHIFIQSEEGEGTTMNIYLSKALLLNDEQPKIEKEMKTNTGNETILVIDDEEMIRNFLEEALNMFTYKVIKAFDGIDGLKKYKDKKDLIDLVILDLSMPNMSGQKVLEEMLKIKKDVKVIINSGYSDDELRKGILLKAKGFINKPFSLAKLKEKIREVLDN